MLQVKCVLFHSSILFVPIVLRFRYIHCLPLNFLLKRCETIARYDEYSADFAGSISWLRHSSFSIDILQQRMIGLTLLAGLICKHSLRYV